MMGLIGGERIVMIHLVVLIQCYRVTDRQTDRRNCHINTASCIYEWARTRAKPTKT